MNLLILLLLIALGWILYEHIGGGNGLKNFLHRAEGDLHEDAQKLRDEIHHLERKRDCCRSC